MSPPAKPAHPAQPMDGAVLSIPVIAIDGPTASGKGTVAQRVAQRLGFHYLDSGSLYRLAALAALDGKVALDDEAGMASLARRLDIRFVDGRIYLGERQVTDRIRTEQVGNAASAIAVLPALRAALVARQRAFRQPPGLVADGRDMGTVIFPDAVLKIFLTASAEARAERRYKQLIEKGFSANMATLLQDLRERDARDAGRAEAPLKAAFDAVLLDSTSLDINQVTNLILDWAARAGIHASI